MDLWIRSQDKTCIKKASAIWISCEPEIPEYYIEVDTDVIGRYKTKERALEVLDEIHAAILTNKTLELTVDKIPADELKTEKVFKLFKDIVYEMPKE